MPIEFVPTADLRQPGDAGPHLVPPGLLVGVQIQILHQQRPGADQTHVTAQHIPQ